MDEFDPKKLIPESKPEEPKNEVRSFIDQFVKESSANDKPESNAQNVEKPNYVVGNNQFDNDAYQKLPNDIEDKIYGLAKGYYLRGLTKEVYGPLIRSKLGIDLNDETIDYIRRSGLRPRKPKTKKDENDK